MLILSEKCGIIKKMNIAVFGGTFDPVHNQHISLIRSAIKELKLDKLIVVPAFVSPHKTLLPTLAVDRLNMLKLALKDIEKVEISTFEIDNGGKSFSYITVEHFRNIYKKDNLFLIVGGDNLIDFKFWKNPERILSCCTLAVFDRKGSGVDFNKEREYFKSRFNSDFIKMEYVGEDCSSTEIRVYSQLNVEPLDTPNSVADYIKSHNLYPKNEYTEFIENHLTEKRIRHTANVICTALKKVKELNLDREKVYLSALLHDCAKYLNKEDYKDFKLDKLVPLPVEHAFLGAYIVEKVLKVKDKDIIEAVKYHTSGKANMTELQKLIFVADMIEKDRDYEGVETLRELYYKDFSLCFTTCLSEEVLHLKNKNSYIFVETLNAYDYYVKK